MQKTLLSAKDLISMGLSRRMAYDLLSRPDMPVVRIGSRVFMQATLFEQKMKELAQEESRNAGR